MPCNCGNNNSLLIVGGEGITVSGSGTGTNPFIINTTAPSFGDILQVQDTETVDLYLSGGAAPGDPLVLKAESRLKVTDLTDVQDPEGGPQPGESIVWSGVGSAGHWVFSTLPPAPAGSVNVGVGMAGTGTAGDPIRFRTSGTWGQGGLAGLGSNTLIGLATYVDVNGQIRVQPPVSTTVGWGEIANRPTTFPPSAHSHQASEITLGAQALPAYLTANFSATTHTHSSLRNATRNSTLTLDGSGNLVYNVDGSNRLVFDAAGVLSTGAVPWLSITNRPAQFLPVIHEIGGSYHSGVLGLDKGGTGANSAAAARTNLDVRSQGDNRLLFVSKNLTNAIALNWDGPNSGMNMIVDGTSQGYIAMKPVSAIRFKDQITAWDYSFDARLDTFMEMEDYTYVEKQDPSQTTQLGWMAERMVDAGFPEIVPIERNPEAPDFGQPTSIDYSRAVVPLHAALKRERKLRIELEEKFKVLEGEVAAMKAWRERMEGGA